MNAGLHSPFEAEQAERAARQSAEALAEGLAKVVQVAHALVRDGSRIDLTGLDGLFGLLCARALDLRPDDGRHLALRLLALRDDLDALSIALAPHGLN